MGSILRSCFFGLGHVSAKNFGKFSRKPNVIIAYCALKLYLMSKPQIIIYHFGRKIFQKSQQWPWSKNTYICRETFSTVPSFQLTLTFLKECVGKDDSASFL
jgi:hypothetical protein